MDAENCPRKSERLFSLLNTFLSSREPLFPQELADTYGVDLRTVERDLCFLRDELFFPLSKIYRGKSRGYRLSGAPPFAKSLAFTPGEIEALYLLRDLGGPLSGTHLQEHLNTLWDKLASHFPAEEGTRRGQTLRYFPGPVTDLAPFSRQIAAVAEGIHRERKVKIVYTSKFGGRKTKAYNIHPYSLILHDRGLYFFGKKDGTEGYRVWAAHRLNQAEVLPEPFTADPDFDLDAHFDASFGILQGVETVTVTLKVTGDALKEFKEMRLHKSIERKFTRDNALLLTLRVMGFEDLRKFILPWCGDVEVVSPASFRAEMKGLLQKALERHQ
ncbi:MAG: WYL domain-containing protein [Fibrobacterota bacterium]